jgi:hypothetical protein
VSVRRRGLHTGRRVRHPHPMDDSDLDLGLEPDDADLVADEPEEEGEWDD